MSKIFYKLSLHPSENGIAFFENRYKSFHETPCYHYCLPDYSQSASSAFIKGSETIVQSLNRRKVKFKRIHKTNSRFAFETKQKAYDNCIYLKKLKSYN